MENVVIMPFAALLIGVFLQILLARFLSNKGKGWLAFLSSSAALIGVFLLLPKISHGESIQYLLGEWDNGISLQFYVDGLGLIFAFMATGIGTAILLYCVQYMDHEKEGVTRFYSLMLIFVSGLVGLVFSANLLITYFFWEIIGLCSYFLVGFWYKQTPAVQGARKVLVMTHIPGYALLAAILLIFHQSGTLIWTDPAVSAAFSTTIFILILVAAMVKSVMVPLHTWIPEAMNAPTPVSALLHSACYVKAGVYLIARMYSLSSWMPAWNTLVLVIGCVTILVGAIYAIVQTDLKRLLAFSTISQLGYIITGLGLGTNLGIAAGLFYCLSHGLFKGTLFLCAGAVQHSIGTRDMRKIGGLASKMPVTTGAWLVAAAAIVGIPLTNGFVAKWLLLDAALDAGQGIVVVIAWLVSIITSFYILKATVSTFYGELPESLASQEIHDAEPTMKIGMAILAGLCLVFGIAPQLLLENLVVPAVNGMHFAWEITVSWLGLQTSSASVHITLGAAILLAGILLGVLVFVLSRKKTAATKTVSVFTGGDPLTSHANVSVVDFSASAEKVFKPVYLISDPDKVYFWLWNLIKNGSTKIDKLSRVCSDKYPIVATSVLFVLVVVTVWIM